MRMPKTVAAPQPAEEGETSGLPGATLRLRIEHHFHQAEVFIWVDDGLAYDQTVDGAVKKKMVVFRGVEGHQSNSLRVAPGEHRFRVRVHATDDSSDQTGTITGELPQEGERQLLILCKKHKPIRLSIQ
ncbi:MAG: hypothetical protein JO249_24540 [Acidobacteria bacterium]|nr:hypothetical protein [Acidobacteriota bacterium]